MTRALVTGGAGFMGSHLIDYLIKEMGLDVIVLDDLSGGFTENINSKATFVKGSILDYNLINQLFAQYQFDYVYHLAAYAAEGLSHFIKRFNYNNNLVGSVNLINASINSGVRRFVFTSSIAVYGTNQIPMVEDLLPQPEDPYGIAKQAVELDLKTSAEMFGLNYTIFRPHNVYGERQNLGDKYRNVIGIFMNRIMQGQDIVIFGDGEQRRAFTYVKDIIPAMARCVEMPETINEIFNVGAEANYSVNQLASAVMSAMQQSVAITHVQARKEVKLAYSDHSKLSRVFAQLPATSLETGIRLMAEWAKSAGIRHIQNFSDIEVVQNLPPTWLS
jgi:UDP-glucose 4-epimerase